MTTYTHRHRIDTDRRCYIVTKLPNEDRVIQVEDAPCTQILGPAAFHHRWVALEPVTGLCGCTLPAVEVVDGLPLCAECAEIERRAG
jgi:hypothetical protein